LLEFLQTTFDSAKELGRWDPDAFKQRHFPPE